MLRSEFKYFVPRKKLKAVRAFIEPYMQSDKHSQKQKRPQYTVRSIYFDTPDFYCYWSKIEGLKHRYKIRIRGYNEQSKKSKVFLEIKKKYEQPIFKNRAPLPFKELPKLFQSGKVEDYIENTASFPNAQDDASRFFYHVHSKNMRPVVCVIYEREAYESRYPNPKNNLRITLDKNLRCTAYPTVDDLYLEERMQWVLRDYFIMEVKFNNAHPLWINPLIESLNLKKEPASKYCMSIDAHWAINPKVGYDTFSYGRFLRGKRG